MDSSQTWHSELLFYKILGDKVGGWLCSEMIFDSDYTLELPGEIKQNNTTFPHLGVI